MPNDQDIDALLNEARAAILTRMIQQAGSMSGENAKGFAEAYAWLTAPIQPH